MINIIFGYASKTLNSTYRFNTAQGLTVAGELKEETSMIEPEVYVAGVAGVNFYEFNVAYIATLGYRYYWIQDIRWMNGRYLISLKVDVLATYKANIGASSQYVLRAASTSNGNVRDSLYPVLEAATYGSYLMGTGQRQNLENGYYIVGVVSNEGSILGSVTYYIMNWKAFLQLRSLLLTDLQWTNVTDISDELLQTLFNPFQYILSVKWTPYTPPAADLTQVSAIAFGYWTFNITATGALAYIYLSSSIPTINLLRYSVSDAVIPKHPQVSRGRYLLGEGYSDYYLMMTGYGRIKIPNYAIVAGYGITIYETLDYSSGESILDVYLGAGSDETTTPVITASGHFAVDLPFSQSDQNILAGAVDAVSGLGGGVANALTGNIGGALQSIAGGIVSAVQDVAPIVKTGGSMGSFCATGEYSGADTIEAVFHSIADEFNADLGRPLCSARTISTLSGYILCANAHCGIQGTNLEQAELEQFLNSGFFYE